MQLPNCIQYIQALGPTIVAIVVGVVAGYIAWRQWQTAHQRLRFDLYDKRFAVYDTVRSLISAFRLHGQITDDEFDEFYQGIRGAEFLFDGDTKNFLKDLASMTVTARMRRDQLQRHPDHPRADQLIAEQENIGAFLQRYDLEKEFSRYLDLSKIGL
jgi:hypothetical protein